MWNKINLISMIRYNISECEEEEGVTYGRTPDTNFTIKEGLYVIMLIVSIFVLIFLAHYFI